MTELLADGLPMNLRDEIDQLRAALDNERANAEDLRAVLKPFAEIGLDVLENHPGWANHVFAGEWCGYRLTYVQFEAAAAAALHHEQFQTGGKDAV